MRGGKGMKLGYYFYLKTEDGTCDTFPLLDRAVFLGFTVLGDGQALA